MILYPQLDLHGELIQFDDLYKERHNNNVNDSLARLHVLEKRHDKESKEQRVHSHISIISLIKYIDTMVI